MRIKLKKSEDLIDWYQIIRAEHDGREWLEESAPNCFRFMTSERLSPEACIEGPSEHMLQIASAIQQKRSIAFKRIAVQCDTNFILSIAQRTVLKK